MTFCKFNGIGLTPRRSPRIWGAAGLVLAVLIWGGAHADEQAVPQTSKAAADAAPKENLREGWRRQVTIPEFADRGSKISFASRLTLRVEQGWLIVRRTTLDDDLEWEVVLARVTDPKPPEVRIGEDLFELRYGSCYIREGATGWLRIFRERKKGDSPAWPEMEVEGRQVRRAEAGYRRPPTTFMAQDWTFIRSGATLEQLDVLLRFRPADWRDRSRPLREGGGSVGSIVVTSSGSGAPHILGMDSLSGTQDTRLLFLDDGDLLVAGRVTFATAAAGMDRQALVQRLGSTEPPPLEGTHWFNTPQPLVLEKLKGRTVLLSFLRSDLPAGLRQLRELQKLHEKVAERGVTIIGIHEGGTAEEIAKLLKEHRVTYPVLIDVPPDARSETGRTAARFGAMVSPMHFLIDPAGTLAWGSGMAVPSEEIERMLLRK